MRSDPKKKGELAEVAFIYEATERGFIILEPRGDSASYDVAVDCGGKISKIQIKSAHKLHQTNCYEVGNRHGFNGRPYLIGSYDFLAATVRPEKAWYIIPAEMANKTTLTLYAGIEHKGYNGNTRRYEKYLDRWDLLA